MRHLLLAAVAAAVASPAAAEVKARSDDGFTLTYERTVDASAAAVFEAVGRPGDWWSDAHSYSGEADNITVDLRPGGCWCEALPGGGVKHAEVVLVWPEQNMVRFNAPFGPLQAMAADAVLTIGWADGEDGSRLLSWTFVVAGPGAGALADPIDAVIGEQFNRLADHLGRD